MSYIQTLVLLPAFLLNCNERPSVSKGAAEYRSPSKNSREVSHENEQRCSIIEHVAVKMHWLASSASTHALIWLRKSAALSYTFKPSKTWSMSCI